MHLFYYSTWQDTHRSTYPRQDREESATRWCSSAACPTADYPSLVAQPARLRWDEGPTSFEELV